MHKVKKSNIASFVLAFVISFSGFTMYVSAKQPEPLSNTIPEVLAEATIAPTMTPSPKPTAIPTKSPSPTPRPTIASTATPSPSPRSLEMNVAIASPSPTATPEPEPTSTPDVWSPPSLEPWFAQYAGQYGVDKNALERIANCESHFNPNASNGDYVGMFQFATQTWINYRNQMGMDPNPSLRTNPEESIRTGAFLMSKRGTTPWPACI